MVKDGLILPQDVGAILIHKGLGFFIDGPFHAVTKSVFDKSHCFHVFASVWVVVSFLVEDYVQVILSGGNVELIVPEI
jgi:hypothetical protein